MLSADEQRKGMTRLGLGILGSIAMALLTAAIVTGLWYFLYGRREKRTPETPQTVTWRTSLILPPAYAVAHKRL
jgi:hypothetical protein